MTAPKLNAAVTIEQIAIGSIVVSPRETRKTLDQATLKELASSIAMNGIQEPLLVRPMDDAFEIIAGQRRHAAAKLAGLTTCPCIVRNVSDEEALELGITSNLQREDVPALEEAEGYAALGAQLGTPEKIAARVGKSVEYVTRRLKLCTLGLFARDALRLRLITEDHALLIAKLGIHEQDEALKWTLDRNAGSKKPVETVIQERVAWREQNDDLRFASQWEPQSVVQLREHLSKAGRRLAMAPWSLDDAELVPERGACADCPSNTKSNLALFGDIDFEEATCADGVCFEEKRDAFVRIRMRTAVDSDFPPLKLSYKITNANPRMEVADVKPVKGSAVNDVKSEPVRTQTFKQGQWILAKKKSCEYAEPGITVDWEENGYGRKEGKPGDLLHVCVYGGCKVHQKAWEPVQPNNRTESAADRKAEEEKRVATRKAEIEIRHSAVVAAIDAVKELPRQALFDLLQDQLPGWGESEELAAQLDIAEGLKPAASLRELARSIAFLYIYQSAYDFYSVGDRKNFLARLKVLGYDGSKLWDKPKAAKKAEPAKKPIKKPAKKAAKKAAKK